MKKSMLRKVNRLTRAQFEKRLGGEFNPIDGRNGHMTNGRLVTYKAYSEEAQGRIDCFCRNLATGKAKSGKNWTELARHLGVS